jgi:hypothetical protein
MSDAPRTLPLKPCETHVGGERPANVVDLMVAELRKHEPLLNQLDFPGTVLLHLNPRNKACPITVHIDYKLPSSTN